MSSKRYQQIRSAVALFIALIVSVSINQDSYLLATAAVLTGMIFLIFVRSRAKIRTDERELLIQEKAARLAYGIFAPTIGLASFFLLLPSKGHIEAFSKGNWLFVESVGMILAYLTLFLISVYSISYHWFNRQFGGRSEE